MEINIKELLALNNPNIIDIRENYQYNMGHIKNSKNINSALLINKPDKYLNKKDTYYIYCNYGNVSSHLCKVLINKGYKAVNVIGGYSAYKAIK